MCRRHLLQRKLRDHAVVSGEQRGIPRERDGFSNLYAAVPVAQGSFVDVVFQFGVDAQRRQLEGSLAVAAVYGLGDGRIFLKENLPGSRGFGTK